MDLIGAVDPRSVERVKATGKHAIFETKSVSYTDLIVRLDRGPGSNPDFVLSMKHLFDREQMVKSTQLGHGVVANARVEEELREHQPRQLAALCGTHQKSATLPQADSLKRPGL